MNSKTPPIGDDPRSVEAAWLLSECIALTEAGKYDEAWEVGHVALRAYKEICGEESIESGQVLLQLTRVAYLKPALDEGLAYGERALGILTPVFGAGHLEVAQCLYALGVIRAGQSFYSLARELFERALTIAEPILGSHDLFVATVLNGLGNIAWQEGAYGTAAAVHRRVIAIREELLSSTHPDVASALNNLGGVRFREGAYSEASALYLRALVILEGARGPTHPDVGHVLSNLGKTREAEGAYRQATVLLGRARAIWEVALGPAHPDIAYFILNNLGTVQLREGAYREAAVIFDRALAILEAALGPTHPKVAETICNLGKARELEGDYIAAAALQERALPIWEATLGSNHHSVAESLSDLGSVRAAQGDYSQATILLERALRIWADAALTELHPSAVETQRRCLISSLGQGDQPTLRIRLRTVLQGEEQLLGVLSSWGSEAAKCQYAMKFWPATEQTISLHLVDCQGDEVIGRLTCEALLRRKARVEDSIVSGQAALRAGLSTEHRVLFDEETALRQNLAALTFAGRDLDPEVRKSRYAVLVSRLEEIQSQLSEASSTYAKARAPVTLEEIQDVIPNDVALVEVVRYRPYQFLGAIPEMQRWSAPRYAAYVVHSDGTPASVDLGEVSAIDALIECWVLGLERGTDSMRASRALDLAIWAPLVPCFNGKTRLFIAPDGQLNRIPWGALLGPDGRYRVEAFALSYLSTGRELLRWKHQQRANGEMLIVGAPDFDGEGALRVAEGDSCDLYATGARMVDLEQQRFSPLPGAAGEVATLGRRLGIEPRTGLAASSELLTRLEVPPALLHLATHAFFKPSSGTGPNEAVHVVEPMLRSGIALAGANRRDSASPGILTALETCRLNLWGTQLVVLSACETGLGEVHTGEGVYGLRRALTVAGSRAQILSLWRIDDEQTSELMRRLYDYLLMGLGPSEALRHVQLEAIAAGVPLPTWAPFVASGCPEPIQFSE